jgi:ADP-dependent NAD(P)H-hydrate dehydratase / NAD(P)H-hydrate epimerase
MPMKILNAQQIRDWDAYTIQHEPIASIELMERASNAFCDWLQNKFPPHPSTPIIHIFCGPGNNGGDGLAVARILGQRFYDVKVYRCHLSEGFSADHLTNLERLPKYDKIPVLDLFENDVFPNIPSHEIVIDAILGTGINRPLDGYWGKFLTHLSAHPGPKIAIDTPSGLNVDGKTTGPCFHADYTLSFELPKLAFLLPDNEPAVGNWEIRSIGLHPDYLNKVSTPYYYIDEKLLQGVLKKRPRHAHKGLFGHALLIAGSYGMVGAALLSGRAILRSGAGLLTIHAPSCAYPILQMGLPEAMVSVDRHQFNFSEFPPLDKYAAVGIGSGLGQKEHSLRPLEDFLREIAQKPLVVDADALNIIAAQGWQYRLPQGCIITPHPKEFTRLFGQTSNDFETLQLQQQKSSEHSIFIIRKGAFTVLTTPDGKVYFNSTGNPGMATAGSGDVLTGVLTGLLAQGYAPETAACLGIYLHGLAGDLAAESLGHEALLAGDIVDKLGRAFGRLRV